MRRPRDRDNRGLCLRRTDWQVHQRILHCNSLLKQLSADLCYEQDTNLFCHSSPESEIGAVEPAMRTKAVQNITFWQHVANVVTMRDFY